MRQVLRCSFHLDHGIICGRSCVVDVLAEDYAVLAEEQCWPKNSVGVRRTCVGEYVCYSVSWLPSKSLRLYSVIGMHNLELYLVLPSVPHALEIALDGLLLADHSLSTVLNYCGTFFERQHMFLGQHRIIFGQYINEARTPTNNSVVEVA